MSELVRKLYIVTGKDPAAKDAAFGSLFDDFSKAESPQCAEFIILDCNDPGEDLAWVEESSKEIFWFTEKCYPPILLAAFKDQIKEPDTGFFKLLKKLYKPKQGGADLLPVCTTPEELLEKLRWFQVGVPFHNQRNILDAASRILFFQRLLELARLDLLESGKGR